MLIPEFTDLELFRMFDIVGSTNKSIYAEIPRQRMGTVLLDDCDRETNEKENAERYETRKARRMGYLRECYGRMDRESMIVNDNPKWNSPLDDSFRL